MTFLRTMLGPSKDEIWAQIAKDIGGHYDDAGFLGHDVLRYRSGAWEISLDCYKSGTEATSTYTRMRAPFANKDGLYFLIHREGFISSIGKFFGMQDIEIGDPAFDGSYLIQGNDEDKIRLLFKDPAVEAADPSGARNLLAHPRRSRLVQRKLP